MPHLTDILQILGVLLAVIVMVVVVRARHRGKASPDTAYANENVCEHLRPALQFLEANGHHVYPVGQHGPDMPSEIHLQPPFDPNPISKELQLIPPGYHSD